MTLTPDNASHPHQFAQFRPCSIKALQQSAPTLAGQWQYSRDKMAKITTQLLPLIHDNPGISCIAVAGSYGRMEASPISDLDLLVIVEDHLITQPRQAAYCLEQVWKALQSLDIPTPEPEGIFMQPCFLANLCDTKALGNLSYPKHVFGQRMQLLLDAQPVFRHQQYSTLLQRVLGWYATLEKRHGLSLPSQYLLHDLMRYFRSYNVLHQFGEPNSVGDSWELRQLKMHHARMLSYIGLLVVASDELFVTVPGKVSQTTDSQTIAPLATEQQSNGLKHEDQSNCATKKRTDPLFNLNPLMKTPLERVFHRLLSDQNPHSKAVLDHYDRIYSQLIDPGCRQILVDKKNSEGEASSSAFEKLMLECGNLREALLPPFDAYLKNLDAKTRSVIMF